jgi:hypothetical protein
MPTENFHSPGSLEGVEYAVAKTDNGYLFEIRLPWSSMLGGPPQTTGLIGIDVFINDDDDGGNTRECQLAWHANISSGWNTPSIWGTAYLVPGKKASNPSPADGSLNASKWAGLSWTAGISAAYTSAIILST